MVKKGYYKNESLSLAWDRKGVQDHIKVRGNRIKISKIV